MQITATKSFRYSGKIRAPGETLTVKDRDGRLLIGIRKAKLSEAKQPEHEDEMSAATKPVKKGTYKRRDMVAEEPSND